MPKLNLFATEERRRAIRAKINYNMALINKKNPDMAKLLGISQATFSNRKRAIDSFTYSDLYRMSRLFGISVSELLCEEEGVKGA